MQKLQPLPDWEYALAAIAASKQLKAQAVGAEKKTQTGRHFLHTQALIWQQAKVDSAQDPDARAKHRKALEALNRADITEAQAHAAVDF